MSIKLQFGMKAKPLADQIKQQGYRPVHPDFVRFWQQVRDSAILLRVKGYLREEEYRRIIHQLHTHIVERIVQ